MARTIKFEGRNITVPDDATDAEVASIINQAAPAPTVSPEQRTTATLKQDLDTDTTKAIQSGIARSAMRTVRGLGTTLLPKSAEQWAEKKGYLPTEQDIAMLEKAGEGNTAAGTAALVGDIAATAIPGTAAFKLATKPFQVAKEASRLKKALAGTGAAVAGGAAAGAAGAGTLDQDVGEGAAWGAALGPAAAVLAKPIAAGGQWIAEKGAQIGGGAQNRIVRELKDLFGDRASEAAATLRALRGELPGEQVTAGMGASSRLPELKALEEGARSRPGAAFFTQIDEANQAARVRPLERMAMPGERQFDPTVGKVMPSKAEEFRTQQSAPFYEQAYPERIMLTPELEATMAGPEARAISEMSEKGLTQAQLLAETAGKPVPMGRLPEQAPFPATRTVEDLHRYRQFLDSKIEKLARSTDPAAELQLRQARDLRKQLSNAMEQSGNFRIANDMFRKLSVPQNQADVAKQLIKELRAPSGAERTNSFLSAVENAPRTLKRADQSARFEHLGEVMAPEQMRDIGAITRSLRREADYANLKAPQGILPKYLSPAEQVERDIPGFLNRAVTATRSMLKRAAGISDEEAQRIVDEAVANPNRLADLLEMVPSDQRSKLVSAIKTIRQAAPAPSLVGGMVGGLAAE